MPGQVWRVSLAPTDGVQVGRTPARVRRAALAHFYDWAGGLVWLCLEPAADAHAGAVRAAVDAFGGHATLIRASDEIARACRCLSSAARAARRADAAREGEFRSRAYSGARAHAGGVLRCRRISRLRALADPDIGAIGKDPARLRALRLLHRDLPDLSPDSATNSIRPRGRIYLIKEMLENERPADARTARHIDRCLSCLSCMTTCPSSVHYMHLVDHARAHIEKTYRRPFADRRCARCWLSSCTRPALFRAGAARRAAWQAFRRLCCRNVCARCLRWRRQASRRRRRSTGRRSFPPRARAKCASPC